MPIFDHAEVHLRERCEAMHAAIRDGRTALKSIGRMTDSETGMAVELYNCPHCKSSIGRKLS